jgi:hypothetical protein
MNGGEEGLTYSPASDRWSLGCVLYRLLTTSIPFVNPKALEAYCNGRAFPSEELTLRVYSSTCIDFVSRLLAVEPDQRLSTSSSHSHPWFEGSVAAQYGNTAAQYSEELPPSYDSLVSGSTGIGTRKDIEKSPQYGVEKGFSIGDSSRGRSKIVEKTQRFLDNFNAEVQGVDTPDMKISADAANAVLQLGDWSDPPDLPPPYAPSKQLGQPPQLFHPNPKQKLKELPDKFVEQRTLDLILKLQNQLPHEINLGDGQKDKLDLYNTFQNFLKSSASAMTNSLFNDTARGFGNDGILTPWPQLYMPGYENTRFAEPKSGGPLNYAVAFRRPRLVRQLLKRGLTIQNPDFCYHFPDRPAPTSLSSSSPTASALSMPVAGTRSQYSIAPANSTARY